MRGAPAPRDSLASALLGLFAFLAIGVDHTWRSLASSCRDHPCQPRAIGAPMLAVEMDRLLSRFGGYLPSDKRPNSSRVLIRQVANVMIGTAVWSKHRAAELRAQIVDSRRSGLVSHLAM